MVHSSKFFSDSYGFIESEDHTRETFFHYSELSVSPDQIEHGTTVQYTEKIKDNKVCGINVRPLGTESFFVDGFISLFVHFYSMIFGGM